MKYHLNVLNILTVLAILWGNLSLTAQVNALEPTPVEAPDDEIAAAHSLLVAAPTPQATPYAQQVIAQLAQDGARISYHAQTGKVRFIGADKARPIPQPAALPATASRIDAARGFLASYGPLFGLTDQAKELTVQRGTILDNGRGVTHFQQVYQGIPVFGGELIVQVDRANNILSANGEILPDIQLAILPTVTAAVARQTALEAVAKWRQVDASALTTTEPELWIYNPILVQPGSGQTRLVWRMEVKPREQLPFRELVLVDAQRNVVALHFNQIDTALNRTIYDNNNVRSEDLALNPPVCTEGNCPGSGNDYNNAYIYAGDTYTYYLSIHSRDSLDGAGMGLVSTVRYCTTDTSYPCPYPNAFWNGAQMVYGQGYASADDVVGHEMTHGVTDYESHLFYYYQSGAINESFSDVWGEFIDLTNGRGNDDPSVRWLMGEDLPVGAVRDMQNPPAYGDPDRMGSANYACAQSEPGSGYGDNGGVHTNSGVNNKAVYLMTDGDTFNGQTVVGLGITKVAKIYYEAQTNLLTSGSDYADLYDTLYQGCLNLVGSAGITEADCQQVRNATNAVEMNQQPSACPAPHAPVCSAGEMPVNLFFDDMESGAGNWAHAAIAGTDYWYLPQNPNFLGWDQTFAISGSTNIWSIDINTTSNTFMSMNGDVALPPSGTAFLHFNHAFGFESSAPSGSYRYDGGILEYSTNGGTSWNDAGTLFDYNGYNGTLVASGTNPLACRQAFSADSRGYISSRLNLSSFAGQNVRFRFRMGTDNIGWDEGWFIDDVRIYTCMAPPSAFNKTGPANGATGQPTNPTLSWETSSGATSYEYCYNAGSPTCASGWTDVGSSTSAGLSGLSASTTYYWQVRASNAVSTTEANGGWWNFTTSPTTPTITSFSPASGPVGTNVTITGTNFTGATPVRFNGTSAIFNVQSSTRLTATVPMGAATGPISVTTPGGVATSGSNFTVVKADTTTTITADNPDPSVVGQAVVVTFTVTANPPGSGTPTGNVTVSDGEGHTCTASVAVGTCALTPTSAGSKTLTATYAGDGNFNASSDTEAHMVNDQAPVANAGNDQNVNILTFVTLDGSGSYDPDDHTPLAYRWQQTGGPAVILSSAVVSQATFTAPGTPTVLTFSLVVTDARGLADPTPDEVVVTVRDTGITNLTAASSSPTTLGQTTFLTVTASGSNITFAWAFGDGTTGGGSTTSHVYSAAGIYTTRVTATNSVSTVVTTLPVTITNLAPVANAGSDQSVAINTLVTLNGSGSYDPDGHTPLAYRWQQTGGSAVILSSAVVSRPTFTAAGTSTVLTFSLVVTDARGLADPTPDEIVVTIMSVPVRGVLLVSPIAEQFGNSGTMVTYTLVLTNTGNTPDTFTSTVSSGIFTTTVTPGIVGPLGAGASQSVMVTAQIPPGAAGDTSDIATVTAISQADPTYMDSVTLTTTVSMHKVFLPLVVHSTSTP